MRIVSAPSTRTLRSDGTSSVTVTDYHPARVFRGRKQEVVRHTYTTGTPTEIEAELGQKGEVAGLGRGNPGAQDVVFSRLRSFHSHCARCMLPGFIINMAPTVLSTVFPARLALILYLQ
jgi:hypothetical protein